LVGLMALWGLTSSCCDKTVEEQVNDIVKDKQEQVDKLAKKEAKLEQELDKVRADKKFAEKELRDAKSRQK
jgi:outer membrane murein-binding lipoprotein Lpp